MLWTKEAKSILLNEDESSSFRVVSVNNTGSRVVAVVGRWVKGKLELSDQKLAFLDNKGNCIAQCDLEKENIVSKIELSESRGQIAVLTQDRIDFYAIP